jgi:hypothetical protein
LEASLSKKLLRSPSQQHLPTKQKALSSNPSNAQKLSSCERSFNKRVKRHRLREIIVNYNNFHNAAKIEQLTQNNEKTI